VDREPVDRIEERKGEILMLWTCRDRRIGLLLFLGALVGISGAGPSHDSWDAVYIAGSKVGHIHTFIEPVKERGHDLLRVRVDMVLNFKRLKDHVTTKMRYGTIEELDGTVLAMDTRILASNQEMRIHGRAVDGKMNLNFDVGGKHQEQLIDWPDDVRGPYAAEQSLSRKPMKPHEVRTLKMYMPDLNRVCDIKLAAAAPEDITLGGGSTRTLLKVEQTTSLDGAPRPEFDVTMWVDGGGQVLKSKTENLGGMVIYRTTREAAEAPTEAYAQFDQITNSVIKVKRKISRPESTRDIRYRISLKDEDPARVIPTDRRQTIEPGAGKNEIILEVKSAGPEAGEPGNESIGAAYLRPNAMITSGDLEVLALTRKAVGTAEDPWAKATRIQKWVANNLKNKNFSIAFAPASEVAQDLSGDCTEHGVLVAAMCRAAGVPARVVVGLVYAENLGGFGFHLWNEVYVNRRWVAIDSSFDQDTVDAAHIKLADASLDGVSPFEAFLPIVRVLGKMTLEPIEIR
jgi:hypothetical protein